MQANNGVSIPLPPGHGHGQEEGQNWGKPEVEQENGILRIKTSPKIRKSRAP
jgi:hypothetical protein